MFDQGPSGTVREGAPGLAPQDESLLLQIPHQNIQEGDNSKEYQQYQKNYHLCCLHICKVPQGAMDYQMQTLMRINQESLRDQAQGHDLN